MASPQRSEGDHGDGQGRREAAASSSSPAASPSSRSWADILSSPSDWLSPLSICSGSLTQVIDHSGETAVDVDGDVRVVEAPDESRAAVPAVPANASLFDQDESTAKSGGSLVSSPSNLHSTFDSADDVGESKPVARSSSASSPNACLEGIEVSTNESCPLCLEDMSEADVLYPIKCPGTCGYNFCMSCMTSFVRSSREDYQTASDGSRQLKIKLNCPNCRADISDIIGDVIDLRRDAWVATPGLEPDAVTSALLSSTMSTSHDGPTFGSATRLKNRSRAPRRVHQKRFNDLLEEIESTNAPSIARRNILAFHGVRTVSMRRVGSTSSLADDALSCSSSRKVLMRALTVKSSPPRASSQRIHRRTQSLGTPPAPARLDGKEDSPRSIMDLGGAFDSQDHKSKPTQEPSPRSPGKKAKGNNLCLEGINFADGGGGFFTNAIDLDWCCGDGDAFEINSRSVHESPGAKVEGKGCGGYVDYSGIYHPCTNAERGSHGEAVDCNGPCQGCIFRRGMHVIDEEQRTGDGEELFYDSDPGQHFAIGSWSKERKECRSRSRREEKEDGGDQEAPQVCVSETASPQRRSQLLWKRRRRKRLGRTSSGETSPTSLSPERLPDKDLPAPAREETGEDGIQRRQENQQAYLYDYFSRNDDADVNAMRTGFCSTKEQDVGQYVQEALNGKWMLQWHVNITGSTKCLPPKTCEVWLERGYRLNRAEIVEPKLMWREVAQPNLREGRKLSGSTLRPYRVSLFALRRIFRVASAKDLWAMTAGQPKHHSEKKATSLPTVAKPDCLIVVRSSLGEDYIFEASCTEERDHLVHLWKMTTARLVSHAVVGNGSLMIQEFFNEGFLAGGVDLSLTGGNEEVDF